MEAALLEQKIKDLKPEERACLARITREHGSVHAQARRSRSNEEATQRAELLMRFQYVGAMRPRKDIMIDMMAVAQRDSSFQGVLEKSLDSTNELHGLSGSGAVRGSVFAMLDEDDEQEQDEKVGDAMRAIGGRARYAAMG